MRYMKFVIDAVKKMATSSVEYKSIELVITNIQLVIHSNVYFHYTVYLILGILCYEIVFLYDGIMNLAIRFCVCYRHIIV